jgi:hypothetical protein
MFHILSYFCRDEYRVFMELFNMAAFLIPYEYKPKEEPPFKES